MLLVLVQRPMGRTEKCFKQLSLHFYCSHSTQQRRREQLLERVECAHVSLSRWPDESSAWRQLFLTPLSIPPCLTHPVFVCVSDPTSPSCWFQSIYMNYFQETLFPNFLLASVFSSAPDWWGITLSIPVWRSFPSRLNAEADRFWKVLREGERVHHVPSRHLQINHSR